MADDREGDLRQFILDLYSYMAEKPDGDLAYRIDYKPRGD